MPKITDILGGLLSPISAAFQRRTDRKMAQDEAVATLAQAKVSNAQEVTLSMAAADQLRVSALGGSWKDEYATVSFISIVNGIFIGAVAAVFGYPQLLNGVVLGVNTLVEAGVDVGTIIEAVTYAAIGLTLWKRV